MALAVLRVAALMGAVASLVLFAPGAAAPAQAAPRGVLSGGAASQAVAAVDSACRQIGTPYSWGNDQARDDNGTVIPDC
ncbi:MULTISPECIES: hypothetical protein [Streptomyces]|uniref:Excalibur calcium-binding domain-containing protein n=1 Tax=Streptomyces viridochromogenes TaxID=1938 RepID=A0A0L8J0Y2_STRVR|nr:MULTISPECIES: hypothetical protein [Streptomyces]KOG07457.1 hypothetical protein ADK34_40340 [Streptomyces viridochromogenes]